MGFCVYTRGDNCGDNPVFCIWPWEFFSLYSKVVMIDLIYVRKTHTCFTLIPIIEGKDKMKTGLAYANRGGINYYLFFLNGRCVSV